MYKDKDKQREAVREAVQRYRLRKDGDIINKMPVHKTLRKYYKDTALTDDELMSLAEWVRVYAGKQHISPDNKLLKVLVAWVEQQMGGKA